MPKKSKFPLSYVVVFCVALVAFVLWSRPRSSTAVPLSRAVPYHSSTMQSARLLKIIDGDTLQISMRDAGTQRTVTLTLDIYGIDSPGMMTRTGQPQQHGERARDYLESFLTPGTDIELDLKGRNEKGQPCAVFVVGGGRDVGCAMLEAGMSRANIAESDTLAATYTRAQQIAQAGHSGIWK